MLRLGITRFGRALGNSATRLLASAAQSPASGQSPQRGRLRMAILQNPGTPPDVSVPLVRLLVRPELLRLLHSPDVPKVVRAAARELLERRPPVPERGDRGEPQ